MFFLLFKEGRWPQRPRSQSLGLSIAVMQIILFYGKGKYRLQGS
jgi:hypothetical protein